MKKYDLLDESLTLATVGTIGTAISTINFIKSLMQNSSNKKLMNYLYEDLFKSRSRQEAINTVKSYTQRIVYNTNELAKKNKKIIQSQKFITLNFEQPLIRIISNNADKNWYNNMLDYMKKNVKKLTRQANFGNVMNAAGVGISAATIGAGFGAIPTGAGTLYSASMAGIGLTTQIIKQLKYFNSRYYISRMISELEVCQDKKKFLDIVDKYCYGMSSQMDKILIKGKKKIPFSIQQKFRSQLFNPISSIVNNSDAYWHALAMDHVRSTRVEQTINHIISTIIYSVFGGTAAKKYLFTPNNK